MEEQSETKAVTCCACSQQCGVLVHLRDGKIVKISGDKDHSFSRGFICVKGARAAELHYSSQRLNWPLKRAGARGEGKWERISWEQAINEIADKVRPLMGRFGAETVAMSFGTFHAADWGLGERFLNLLGSPNTVGQDKVCYGPTTIAEMLTYGFGPTSYTYPVPGLTKCIVLWGMRPSASMPLLWAQIVKARRAGAKLIVVDPLLTTEARQADLWLQLRPGSDAALALGWLNVVIGAALYDHAFVGDSTVGFQNLAERVASWTPGQPVAKPGCPRQLSWKRRGCSQPILPRSSASATAFAKSAPTPYRRHARWPAWWQSPVTSIGPGLIRWRGRLVK